MTNMRGTAILAAGYISLLLLIAPLYYWSITRMEHCASNSQPSHNFYKDWYSATPTFGTTGVVQ